MANVQSFDSELVTQLKSAREVLEEGFSGVKSAFEASVELGHSHNLPVLERESTSGLEGAEKITKLYTELDDSLAKLIEYYEKLEAAIA